MPGLINTATGLRYGTGLFAFPGLGGGGLINPTSGGTPPLFAGSSRLLLNTIQRMQARPQLAGAGSLSIRAVPGVQTTTVPLFSGWTKANIYGMSYDGATFVGFNTSPGQNQVLYTWTQAGGYTSFLPLLNNGTFAGMGSANQDATTVVGYAGYSSTDNYQHAAVWRGGPNNWTVTDLTPTYKNPAYSQASGCSADGSIVVGFRTPDGSLYEAFVWVSGGMTVLASTGVAGAYNCSTDGSVVVGYNGTNFSDYQACYWREGVRTSIGALPGDTTSYATGCSNDGSVIVGVSTGATNHGFRWTAGTGMVDIGVAPGARSNVQVRVCSGDGSALVGIAAQTNYTDNVAFRWSLLDGYTILGGPDADGVTISKNGTIMGGDNYIQGQIWRLV